MKSSDCRAIAGRLLSCRGGHWPSVFVIAGIFMNQGNLPDSDHIPADAQCAPLHLQSCISHNPTSMHNHLLHIIMHMGRHISCYNHLIQREFVVVDKFPYISGVSTRLVAS